jgi:hypothetical protein
VEGSFCQDENYLRYAAEESLNFVKLELRHDLEEDTNQIKLKLEIKFILKCFGKICLMKVILKMKM